MPILMREGFRQACCSTVLGNVYANPQPQDDVLEFLENPSSGVTCPS